MWCSFMVAQLGWNMICRDQVAHLLADELYECILQSSNSFHCGICALALHDMIPMLYRIHVV